MGDVHPRLDEELVRFIAAQHVFFVATAPSGAEGHVNLSPKGHDTFRIIDPTTVAYLDLTGSGVETIAHLRDNGRITLMFCAFEGRPRILRLYGHGEPLLPGEGAFEALRSSFPGFDGVRSIIRVRLHRVATSCGYAVPQMAYEGERDTLHKWVARKGPLGIEEYQLKKNAASIDGLPGLPAVGRVGRSPEGQERRRATKGARESASPGGEQPTRPTTGLPRAADALSEAPRSQGREPPRRGRARSS